METHRLWICVLLAVAGGVGCQSAPFNEGAASKGLNAPTVSQLPAVLPSQMFEPQSVAHWAPAPEPFELESLRQDRARAEATRDAMRGFSRGTNC